MLITQSLKQIGKTKELRAIGIYYDEVQLSTDRGYGYSIADHVKELENRSDGKIVVGCEISWRQGTSHPSYNTKIVSVTGDICEEIYFWLDI